MDRFLLTNKNALITGSSSGIGRTTSELFVELGANVLITGRNEKRLQDVQSSCLSKRCNKDQKVVTFIADLSKEEEVRKLSEKTLSEFPVLDILVNNAGEFFFDNIGNLNLNIFDEHLNTNLKSVMLLCQLLIPTLICSKGCIVNVSSDLAINADPTILSYCIGKAALDQFTRCIALDLAPKGVRVNSINPGIVTTDIFRKCGLNDEEKSSLYELCSSMNALGRSGDVMEIACGIVFLASPASSFTVGCMLHADGGQR